MDNLYRDLDFRMIADPLTGDVSMLENIDCIKISIINLILTSKRERLFNSDVGTNINTLMFENVDHTVIFRIQRQIQFVLQNYEPRINNISVKAYFIPDEKLMIANVSFNIVGSSETISINLPLEAVR